jgi:hypothetical protein
LKRGSNHGTGFDEAIAYIHGRLEIQIEQFSASLGIQSIVLAERLADLLSPARQRNIHSVSIVRSSSTGHGTPLVPLALAESTHSQLSNAEPIQTTSNAPHKMRRKAKKVNGGGWGSMTPEQRSKEMKRRMLVAKGKAKSAKEKGKKRNMALQKIYQARHEARRLGLPLPPLPSEQAANNG